MKMTGELLLLLMLLAGNISAAVFHYAPMKLIATSDAGLPVEFYVAHGPAVVNNGMMRIVDRPARAKFPVSLKIVAWQFGRGVEPLVQSAQPVEQVIQIEKP